MDLTMLKTEQDKRNFIRNSDDNLFVEAGPGAGKTTFISRRIINQIKKGASPDNFVFIAFTKEAAQEIRDKIRKNIKRDLVKAENDEEETLARALVSLPGMSIVTFAEFCIAILERAGIDTGIYNVDAFDVSMSYDLRKLCIDTMECLRTDGKLLDEIKSIYTHIYVDEYQDTNELQTAILWMIATDASGEKLRDGALFLVGDDKQSIYMSEGADVAVFKRIRSRMQDMENAGVITLYENYRSEEQVIDFINDRFSKLFSDYSFAKKDWTIKKQDTFHGVMSFGCECLHYTAKDDIFYTAKLIKELVNGEQYMLEDKNNGETRRLAYSDFLVIVGNETIADSYLAGAGKEGIDITADGIKVMSLHAVKGLSGNIVIMADRSRSMEEYFQTTELSEEQVNEWRRFEYVAATRARHAIIFMPEIVGNCKFSASDFRLEELPVFRV